MLQEATGYSPSQVTVKPVCGAARPGYASCDSEMLVTRSGQQPVHPLTVGSQRGGAAGSSPQSPSAAGSSPSASSPSARSGQQAPAATVQVGAPSAYTPAFLQEAYDTGWLSSTAGAGRTIAIVDAYDDPNALSDLATFRSQNGLPSISSTACTTADIATHSTGGPCVLEINQSGQTSPLPAASTGWGEEESLDLDAVSSMCPNCNILYIETNSAYDNDLAAGDAEALTLGVKLISNSFGGPSAGDTDYFTQTEAATGDASNSETFASTGDDGAYVDQGYPGQTNANQAPYPASEPGITAVGGTALDPSAGARGIQELAWSGAGSACSTFDSQPSWQANADTGCSGRASSDISADADPQTGLDVYDTYGTSGTGWQIYGGTSLAAPLTAAYTALTGANSASTRASDGALSAEWAYADSGQLNDVTGGSNGSCPAGTAYASFQTCNAGPGWDGPTGVGSITGALVSGGPSLTVPPQGGVDQAGDGYSIVQALGESSATFDGGVYPNGADTTVWWEYSTSSDFSAATSTATVDVGSGTAPVLATPASVGGLTAGTTYYVRECAANADGDICGNSMSFQTPSDTTVTPDSNDKPVITDAEPLTSGQYTVGDTLSTDTGGWLNGAAATFTYQWCDATDSTESNMSPISGATSSTYTLQSTDVGKYVFAIVSAGSWQWATSAVTPIRAVAAPAGGRTSQIWSSNLGLGATVSLNAPTWSPGVTSVSYQWQESADGTSDWTNVGSATSSPSSYTIQDTDSSHYIRASITGTNSAGSATVDSNSLQVDDLGPSPSGSATLTYTGLGLGGQLSIASTPTWTPAGATVTYQWQESPNGTSGWTSLASPTTSPSTYTITLADSRHYIRAAVTATDDGGPTTVESDAVQVQNLAPAVTGSVSITDTGLGLGAVITADDGLSWSGASTIADQWQESGDGSSWTDIADATGPSYTIQAADSLEYIRLEVTGTNAGGSTPADSNVLRVEDLSPSAPSTGGSQSVGGTASVTAAPILRGRPRVGGAVTVSGGSYANAGAVTVTFERCDQTCTTVQSGGSTSYRLRRSDAGHYLVARVTVYGTGTGTGTGSGSGTGTSAAAPVSATATGLIGPVVSPRAGALRITGAAATLRSGSHVALLTVRRRVLRPRGMRSRLRTYVLTLTRPARLGGPLRAWACVQAGARIVSCTRRVNLRHRARLTTRAPAGERVELIAVR